MATRNHVHFLRFLRWHVVRYLMQHPLLAALNILSVAIGVAVFLAVQLANESAAQAFRSTIDFVAGKSDLEVSNPSSDVPEDLLPKISQDPDVVAATPLVRGIVTLPDYPGEYLDILGIDFFTDAAFRMFELTDADARNFDVFRWLRGPDVIAVSERFVADHRLQIGDRLRSSVNGKRVDLTIGFIMRGTASGAAEAHFAAMDIGWAQELFDAPTKLNSIQIKIRPGINRAGVMKRLTATMPANVFVAPPQRRSEQIEKIVGSFQMNLTALSLVALLVGVFLIYNTVSASVVRRRRELGVLRSLGVSSGRIQTLFIMEALLLASVGTLLGLILGTLLARSLIATVSHTISSLYLLVSIQNLSANAGVYLAATAVGIFSGGLAAWIPARRAAALEIAATLRPDISLPERSSSVVWNVVAIALLICAIFGAWWALAIGPPIVGFVSAFCTLAGFSFFAPAAIRLFARAIALVLRRTGRDFLTLPLASAHLARSLGRNSVTVAALASAVAMTIGVTVMIFSFRKTVGTWIEQTLVADVFIAPASNEITGPVSFVPPAAVKFFEADPRVSSVDTFRQQRVSIGGESSLLGAVRANGAHTFPFVRGDGDELMRRFRSERCAIVSESFARRRKVAPGENLPIDTPSGSVALPVIGVFYDYTRDEGVVFTNTETFESLFKDERVNSIALYLKSGADGDAMTMDFRRTFVGAGEFAIYRNRELRRRVFEIFDQTFAVTYVLQAVAIVVALTGTFLAFTTLVAERTMLLGLMRAVGMSAPQIARLLLLEAGMIGTIASALGLIAGLALAAVLTGVINRAFFGWTVQLNIPWRTLWTTPVWVIGSAVAAALLPAWRTGRRQVGEALRFQ